MKIKNLIFDNDGTLYKIEPKLKEDIIQSMASYLSNKLSVSEKEAKALRKRLIRKYGVESTEFVFEKEYNIPYDEFVKSTYLSVDVRNRGIKYDKKLRDLLQKIKLSKSVLTNNPSEFARKILSSLGVEDLFENVIGSMEIGYKLKPSSEAFLKAIEVTGYDPKKTMFVDDIPQFHRAAKKIGMTTVLIGSERNYPYVDYNIESLFEIKKILGAD
jgi:pyrimidine 5'-nucleotidase